MNYVLREIGKLRDKLTDEDVMRISTQFAITIEDNINLQVDNQIDCRWLRSRIREEYEAEGIATSFGDW